MATPLPPFGIRNLRPSVEPFSVLQVDEAQYTSTIQTDPTATLSYIDEDDGEKITIGSSIELKQRLEDPPSRNAPLVQCYNAADEQLEGRYIHLFDIKSSCTSQTAWTEHHASYARRSEKYADRRRSNSLNSTLNKRTVVQDGQGTQSGVNISNANQRSRQTVGQTSDQAPLATILSDAIPDLVDNLAALLETTSNTLRRAAEKTRESNTSPVEDVLSGMSSIVTEIGIFGTSLLETVEKSTRPARSNDEAERPSAESSAMLRDMDDDLEDDSSVSALDFDDDVSSVQANPQDRVISPEEPLEDADDICVFCKSFRLNCRKSPNSTMACTNCVTLAQPCSRTPKPVNPFLDPPQEHSDLTLSVQKPSSILDQDTEDADFSRRYPPLLSLRRANTVAGLRECATQTKGSDVLSHDLSRHNSWAVRFPHRPVPQVLDAETQRRRDFARLCFPAQTYTPGPGTKEIKVPRPHSSKNSKVASSADLSDLSLNQRNATVAGSMSIAQAPVTDDDNSTPPARRATRNLDAEDGTETGLKRKTPDNSQPQLPGSWPRLDDKQAPSKINTEEASGESSGALFHRMMRDHPSQRRDHKIGTSKRLVRHKSLIVKRPDQNADTGLTRSSTFNSGTNPASRLNRPFDPLYPLLVSPSNAAPLQTSSDSKPGPSTDVKTNDSAEHQTVRDDAPAPSDSHRFGSSQRPTALQRPFSPVWEDHLNENKGRDKANRSSLDHKGESSSMYSPPPRHMKSMPTFRSFSTDPTGETSLPAHFADQPATREGPPVTPITFNPFSAVPPPSVPHPSMTATSGRYPAFPPPPPPPPPHWPMMGFASPMPPPPPPPAPLHPFSRPPHPLRHIQAENATQQLPPAVQSCLNSLVQMGYGSDDDNLKDRLHVYAAAANGDVMSAVEMIEEDKQAHFSQEVTDQLRERGEWYEDNHDHNNHNNLSQKGNQDLDEEWAST